MPDELIEEKSLNIPETNEGKTNTLTVTLPSLGLVYDEDVNPTITLRAMEVWDEMLRQGSSNDGADNVKLAELLNDCILKPKPGINPYDMCLGDFLFLLKKLRELTYGPIYESTTICGRCGEINNFDLNLDDIQPNSLDSADFEEGSSTDPRTELSVYLPDYGDHVKLNFNTARITDSIEKRVKKDNDDYLKRTKEPNPRDRHLYWQLFYAIKTIEGIKPHYEQKEDYVRHMTMMDALIILTALKAFDEKVGLGVSFSVPCNHCGQVLEIPFRLNSMFWRPSKVSKRPKK